jgi:putative tricarboxylic transport membrane protein
VPHAAILVTMVFGVLNLITELFGAEDTRTAQAHPGFDLTANLAPGLVRMRALRFFLWLALFLACSAALGLLPALFVLILLQTRFEFDERWPIAGGTACAASVLLYLLFDRVFAVPWPQSALGDLLPGMRAITGLV